MNNLLTQKDIYTYIDVSLIRVMQVQSEWLTFIAGYYMNYECNRQWLLGAS